MHPKVLMTLKSALLLSSLYDIDGFILPLVHSMRVLRESFFGFQKTLLMTLIVTEVLL